MNNPIIDEVRAARAALAKEHGYDRAKILEWARLKQAELESNATTKERIATARKPYDEIGQRAAAPQEWERGS